MSRSEVSDSVKAKDWPSPVRYPHNS